MDKVIRAYASIVLMVFSTTCIGQESSREIKASKSSISINGLRYASAISISYAYSFWQNGTNNFRLGMQSGIGYGPKAWETFSELSVPIGIFTEYGKKHRIGFDANIIYQYRTRTEQGISPSGIKDYRVVYDNGVFTSSLYYSYNFGLNMRYAAGIGGNFISYFGSNYGFTVNYPNQIAPFIFFNVRF